MKHCNNFRRMFRAAAVLAAVALMTFAGCTKVDDTLGSIFFLFLLFLQFIYVTADA